MHNYTKKFIKTLPLCRFQSHICFHLSPGKQVAVWVTKNVALDKGQCRERQKQHTADGLGIFSMKQSETQKPKKNKKNSVCALVITHIPVSTE